MFWAVWATLAVSVLATCAGGAYALRRAFELWRCFRAVRRDAGDALAALEERGLAVAEKAAAAGESPELDRSLAQLRESVRRVNVLRSALQDATDMVGRATAVYPRK